MATRLQCWLMVAVVYLACRVEGLTVTFKPQVQTISVAPDEDVLFEFEKVQKMNVTSVVTLAKYEGLRSNFEVCNEFEEDNLVVISSSSPFNLVKPVANLVTGSEVYYTLVTAIPGSEEYDNGLCAEDYRVVLRVLNAASGDNDNTILIVALVGGGVLGSFIVVIYASTRTEQDVRFSSRSNTRRFKLFSITEVTRETDSSNPAHLSIQSNTTINSRMSSFHKNDFGVKSGRHGKSKKAREPQSLSVSSISAAEQDMEHGASEPHDRKHGSDAAPPVTASGAKSEKTARKQQRTPQNPELVRSPSTDSARSSKSSHTERSTKSGHTQRSSKSSHTERSTKSGHTQRSSKSSHTQRSSHENNGNKGTKSLDTPEELAVLDNEFQMLFLEDEDAKEARKDVSFSLDEIL